MSRLTIEWLLADGRGAGRSPSGGVVRVAGAVPGDVLDAGSEALVEPSPHRRAAPCPWADACGGCDLGHLESSARGAILARTVAHAFRVDQDPTFVPSPRAEGHRARIKLAVEAGRVGYRRPRSHDLVDVERCLVARPEVQRAHERLRAWTSGDPERTRGLTSVELRSDGERVVFSFTAEGSVPRPVRDALADLGDVALDGRTIVGDPALWLGGLRAGPRSFYQVNLEQNEALVAHVRDAVLARAPERVLDLFAGIGNLSFPLARAGVPVVAVEAPGPGASDLALNARALGGVEAVSCRVERFDPSRVPFDAVVLDPPRAGAPGVLRRLARNRPKVVVYVSCHAPSAARDIKELDGYRLVDLTCFDLFPDTHHVEAVAVLERA